MLCARCRKNLVTSKRSRYCHACSSNISDTIMGIHRRDEDAPLTLTEKIDAITSRKEFRIFLGCIVLLGFLYAYGFFRFTKRHPPGVLVSEAPLQTSAADVAPWQKNDFTITPLYRYEIKGVVLTYGNFFFTSEASLSPVDVTLGWGPLSDQAIIDQMTFIHAPRWVAISLPDGKSPIAYDLLSTSFSNNHLIPANDAVASTLKRITKGDILTLKGYLISATNSTYYWSSSTTRTDTGQGACEVMWVDAVMVE